MSKRYFLIIAIVGIASLFLATGIYAGAECPDMIKMDNPAYSEHTMGIVTFSHKRHFEGYKLPCGECHHDDSGQPRNDLKVGDEVDGGCIDCHDKAAKAPKVKKGEPRLSKSEKLEYHADALHISCKECHRKEKKAGKNAPTFCDECHPKK